MGTIRRSDGEIFFEREGVGEARKIESGDVTVEFGSLVSAMDVTPLFRGLPDDMCQCRHLGYVIRGRFIFNTKEGPVEVAAGEAFDISPGHIPVPQPGCEWVMFTDTAEQKKTFEAIQRNTAAGAGSR